MIQSIFKHSTVKTYSVGKHEQIPSEFSQLPTASMEQTHSSNFHEINVVKTQQISDCDALITTQPRVHLKVKHADCLPVLLYHPRPLVAVVHAGRKSSEQDILKKVLLYVKDKHQIESGLSIWFGPSICKQCYQIDKVTNQHYDLLQQNTEQVRSIYSDAQAQILYSNLCTAHQNKKYFSYRKEGPGVPMNWSGIVI